MVDAVYFCRETYDIRKENSDIGYRHNGNVNETKDRVGGCYKENRRVNCPTR